MRHCFKNSKGFTLIEILIAITLMGILIVGILGVFGFSVREIFTSGNLTKQMMETQKIVDDLQVSNPHTETDIDTHLNAKGYLKVNAADELSVKSGSCEVNYFIQAKNISGVAGFEVTVAKFYGTANRAVRLSVFII